MVDGSSAQNAPMWEQKRLNAFLCDSPRAYRIGRRVLLTGMTLAVATFIWRGCAPLVEYPHDSLMMLDYGSRLVEGQRPHADYYSPMGFMAYALTAVGIALVGPCGAALGLGYLLLCPILTLWSWWLASARLAALPALLFAAMAGLLLMAPFAIGRDFQHTSYAMQY